MTRFEQEISGMLGDWWKDHAEKEVAKLVETVKVEATVDQDGALKWNSNGRFVPDDVCEKLEFAGYDFDRQMTALKRDKQIDESLMRHREVMKNHKISDEEMLEMRNAFGSGTKVVNVLTGEEVIV